MSDGSQEEAAELPCAARLKFNLTQSESLHSLKIPPHRATTPAVQLPITLGESVDAMSSLSELNAFIALANYIKWRSKQLFRGVLGEI